MKYIFIFIITVLTALTSFGQNTLKGRVTDAKHEPLFGATITLNQKQIGTTDKDGNFSINCPGQKTINISYVGYQPSSFTITNCTENVAITLTNSNIELNAVEVTSVGSPNKSLLYQPASISKLETTEIKRSTGLFFDDVINTNVPGVSFERRTVNGGQQFNIRGYGNGSRGTRGVSSNFDGQGYKVYINGIPVTDAEGITVMDDIDFGSIGGVDILKGPSGTLYGLAIAGAINLRTVRPEAGKFSIGQDIMVGSYGLQRYTTHLQKGGENSSLLLNYGHQKSDGYFIHNKSHKDFMNLVTDFQIKDKQTVNVYLGFTNSYDERGGEQTIDQYQAKNDTGNLEYVKRNAHSHLTSYRAGVGHKYIFNNWLSNTTTLFGTSLVSDVSSAGGWTDKLSLNYGARSTFATRFELSKDVVLSGTTGYELQQQRASTTGYSMKKNPLDASTASAWKIGDPYWVINAISSNNATVCGTSSYFTEWTLSLPKDILLLAGLGVSNMKITLNDRFTNDTITKTFSGRFDTTYKNLVSPHFAINKVFNKNFSVYASYSSGFKAPVSSYFFITTPKSGAGASYIPAAGRVNSSLKPERGDQVEIGSKGALLKGKLSYQIAYFNAKFKNKMTTVAVPNENGTATSYVYVVNGGSQVHNGFEALLKYDLYKSDGGFVTSIRPFVNFTYSDFKYKDYAIQSLGKTVNTPIKDSAFTTNYSGHNVAGVPKITANLGADFTFKYGLYANFTYSYRDTMPITSDGLIPTTVAGKVVMVPYHASSFALLNAKVGIQQTLAKHLDLDFFVGVNNITNSQYPIMVFVNQIPDAYMPAPRKANAYAGLNLKYNF